VYREFKERFAEIRGDIEARLASAASWRSPGRHG
jgi:hypothetical protein